MSPSSNCQTVFFYIKKLLIGQTFLKIILATLLAYLKPLAITFNICQHNNSYMKLELYIVPALK